MIFLISSTSLSKEIPEIDIQADNTKPINKVLGNGWFLNNRVFQNKFDMCLDASEMCYKELATCYSIRIPYNYEVVIGGITMSIALGATLGYFLFK